MDIIRLARNTTLALRGTKKNLPWSSARLAMGRDITGLPTTSRLAETECSEQTWLALPETEEEAIAHDGFLVKGESDVCTVCDGTGEVEYEDDYEPDYDDDWR